RQRSAAAADAGDGVGRFDAHAVDAPEHGQRRASRRLADRHVAASDRGIVGRAGPHHDAPGIGRYRLDHLDAVAEVHVAVEAEAVDGDLACFAGAQVLGNHRDDGRARAGAGQGAAVDVIGLVEPAPGEAVAVLAYREHLVGGRAVHLHAAAPLVTGVDDGVAAAADGAPIGVVDRHLDGVVVIVAAGDAQGSLERPLSGGAAG